MRPSSNLKKGLATANPAMYCAEDDDDGNNIAGSNNMNSAAGDATSAVSVAPSASAKQSKAASPPDASTFDIVKATQYGAFDRVRQIIQEEGRDVTTPDDENVTLLHWAAINNRKEISNYLIKQVSQWH